MDVGLGLNTTLKQEQNLTPQMLQALALLPMPLLELKAHIQSEIESNPALEIPNQEFESNLLLKKEDDYKLDSSMDDATEADYESFTNSRQESGEDFYKGSGDYSGSFSDSEASDRFQQMMENTSNTGETLQQHLESQLLESTTSPTVQNLAKLIISNLDNKGFFSIPLESLFSNIQGYEEEKKEALDLIRSFDPYGVGVSNYRESLVLQGQILGLDKEDLAIFSSLVFDYLDKLKGGKNHEVARALKISDSTLEEFYSILKSLNPYPGLQYGDDAFHYIEPDFSVHNIDGDLVLDINRHGIPSLSISQEFSSLTNEMESDGFNDAETKEASAFVSKAVKNASLLINQVNLRFKTLTSAALAIIEIQRDFFLKGPRYLKTMSLKDVAEKINVHETTMSRLAQGKYIDTDWGLFPMKYLFSQGVKQEGQEKDSENVSRNVVKDIIKEIIESNNEAKGKSLSDQKISDLLLERGIKCARRTVSKYRSELNIESSYTR